MKGAIFDISAADQGKQLGLNLAASNRESLLAELKAFLKYTAAYRTVSADDAYLYMKSHGMNVKELGAGAGALFRGTEWECVGWRKSARVSNHSRFIREWRLKRL